MLQQLGILAGVISNMSFSGAALSARLKKALPFHNFSFILTSSDYLFRKPHPRIFQLVLEKADLPPEDVWFCGDDLTCDIRGAKAVGITPIWDTGCLTQTPPCPEKGICTIGHWDVLCNKLEELSKFN